MSSSLPQKFARPAIIISTGKIYILSDSNRLGEGTLVLGNRDRIAVPIIGTTDAQVHGAPADVDDVEDNELSANELWIMELEEENHSVCCGCFPKLHKDKLSIEIEEFPRLSSFSFPILCDSVFDTPSLVANHLTPVHTRAESEVEIEILADLLKVENDLEGNSDVQAKVLTLGDLVSRAGENGKKVDGKKLGPWWKLGFF